MGLTVAEIYMGHLLYNFNQIKKLIDPSCKVLAVVKANAYGHGIVEISKALEKHGVDMLGVAHVDEGILLRENGIKSHILVLGVIDESEAERIVKWQLRPVVYTLPMIEALSKMALKYNSSIPVHIKIDTGMRRIGIEPQEVISFVKKTTGFHGIKIEGIMTHFAEADLGDIDFIYEQLNTFISLCKELDREGIYIPLRHVANSAAIITLKESHFNMVRPGIMLYGYLPSSSLEGRITLKPVLKLKSRIIHLRKVPPGTGISYGRTFVTTRETLVATVAIGYGDGYSRRISNRGEVLVRGKRAPVIGRICMDMTMIDVTHIPHVAPGDEVILIGEQGNERITADDVAGWSDTISYEVLCAISERVKRVYYD